LTDGTRFYVKIRGADRAEHERVAVGDSCRAAGVQIDGGKIVRSIVQRDCSSCGIKIGDFLRAALADRSRVNIEIAGTARAEDYAVSVGQINGIGAG